MKKSLGIFVGLIAMMILAACGEEDRSYTIDELTVDAMIQADGTVAVRELFTYTFDGKYNGMTRSSLENMEAFEAYEVAEDDPAVSLENKQALKVTTNEEEEDLLEIHTPAQNETKQVLYSYKMKGVVDKYVDVAEMNYTFFPTSDASPIENIDIRIHGSGPVDKQEVYAFLHTNNGGELTTKSDGISYHVAHLDKGQRPEINIIFPATQVADAKVTKDKKVGEQLIAKEEALERKRAQVNEKTNHVLPWLLGAIVLMLLFSGYMFFTHPNRYRGNKDTDYFHRLLEKYDPLFVQYINDYCHLNPHAFVAGLLSLKRRGVVAVEEVPLSVVADTAAEETTALEKTDSTLRFSLLKENNQLDMADRYLIEWLFTEEDEQGRFFYLDALIVQEEEAEEKKMSKAEAFESSQERWSELVKQRDSYQGLKHPFQMYSIYAIVSVFMTYCFFYYFTRIDVLTGTGSLLAGIIPGVLALSVLFFNRNKWIISLYFVGVIVTSFIAFSFTTGFAFLISFLLLSWGLLLAVPAFQWREDINRLKKAITVAYTAFKKKQYPVGTDLEKVERRLEYAIVLGAGKEYAETCEEESVVEKLTELDSKGIYPLLHNPVMATTVFDPTFLVLYSTSSAGATAGFSGGSTGGGGTGAF